MLDGRGQCTACCGMDDDVLTRQAVVCVCWQSLVTYSRRPAEQPPPLKNHGEEKEEENMNFWVWPPHTTPLYFHTTYGNSTKIMPFRIVAFAAVVDRGPRRSPQTSPPLTVGPLSAVPRHCLSRSSVPLLRILRAQSYLLIPMFPRQHLVLLVTGFGRESCLGIMCV